MYSDISPNTLKEIHYITKLKVSCEIHHCQYFFNSAKVLCEMLNTSNGILIFNKSHHIPTQGNTVLL